jgi:hypothetical protein
MYPNNMSAGYNPMGAGAPMAPQKNGLARGCSLGCVVACLLALAVLTIPALLLGAPAWRVRTQGVQAQGTATLAGSCGSSRDENGNEGPETFQVIIHFTDQQGRPHQVGSHWACNNFYDNGESVSLWYLPDDPSTFLTAGEAIWLYIVTAIWGIFALALVAVLVIALVLMLRRPKPAAPQPMAWG